MLQSYKLSCVETCEESAIFCEIFDADFARSTWETPNSVNFRVPQSHIWMFSSIDMNNLQGWDDKWWVLFMYKC